MAHYRAYVVSKENHIEGAPTVMSCDDDQEAIERALPLVNGHDVELWEGTRLVTRLRSGAK